MIMATKDDEKVRVKPNHTAPLPEQDRTNPQFSSAAILGEAPNTGEMPRDLPPELTATAPMARPTIEEMQALDQANEAGQERKKPTPDQRGELPETLTLTSHENNYSRVAFQGQVVADENLASSTKLVLLVLALLFDESGTAKPSKAHLGRLTNLSQPTIRDHLERAEEAGYIAIEKADHSVGQILDTYHARVEVT